MFPHESKCYRRLVFDEEEEYLDYIEELSELLKEAPSDVTALNNRGVAYYELGRLDECIADLKSACDVSTVSTPFLNLAEAIATQGDLDEAVTLASRAIRLSPGDSSSYAVRAGFYEKKGDSTRAKQDLDAFAAFSATKWSILGVIKRMRYYLK